MKALRALAEAVALRCGTGGEDLAATANRLYDEMAGIGEASDELARRMYSGEAWPDLASMSFEDVHAEVVRR